MFLDGGGGRRRRRRKGRTGGAFCDGFLDVPDVRVNIFDIIFLDCDILDVVDIIFLDVGTLLCPETVAYL